MKGKKKMPSMLFRCVSMELHYDYDLGNPCHKIVLCPEAEGEPPSVENFGIEDGSQICLNVLPGTCEIGKEYWIELSESKEESDET